MYEKIKGFFKKYKQFFIGIGVAIAGMFAYIFNDSKRDRTANRNIIKLSNTLRELREQLSEAEDLNRQLRQQHNSLTAEFSEGMDELRSENERIHHELSEQINSSKSIIRKAGSTNTDIGRNIEDIKSATERLRKFIQENGNTN